MADLASVQENVEGLCCPLKPHGWPVNEVLIIGDRAKLNDELAIAYDDHGLRYLAATPEEETPGVAGGQS